ncbi:unnamed protein product [Nippostrongylus brasiliensis]|uniref:Hydrogenase n=1 Tax=Nippostrongylus brasiliensis TaxID=27835 RepID=A0A0N4YPB3_NIPBR|nr:unnamed protein product [Nippostrongylus brasiliensis]
MNDANITETTTFSVDQVQSIDIFKSRAHVGEAQAIAFLQGKFYALSRRFLAGLGAIGGLWLHLASTKLSLDIELFS